MLAFQLASGLAPADTDTRRALRQVSWRTAVLRPSQRLSPEPSSPRFTVSASGRRRGANRQAPTVKVDEIQFDAAPDLQKHLKRAIISARRGAHEYRMNATRVLLNSTLASRAKIPVYCRQTSITRPRPVKPVTVISINSAWRLPRARRMLEAFYEARASSENYRVRLSDLLQIMEEHAGREEVAQLSVVRSWDCFEMAQEYSQGLLGLSEWENIREKLSEYALVQLAAEGRMRFYQEEVVALERADKEARRAQVNARLKKIFFDMPPASTSPEPDEDPSAPPKEEALPPPRVDRRYRQPGAGNRILPARWIPTPFSLVNLVIAVPRGKIMLRYPDVCQLPDEVHWRRKDGRSRLWSYRNQREIIHDLREIACLDDAWVSFSVWNADASLMHGPEFWKS